MSQYKKPLSSSKTISVLVPIRERKVKMRILVCIFALTFSKPDKGEHFSRAQNVEKYFLSVWRISPLMPFTAFIFIRNGRLVWIFEPLTSNSKDRPVLGHEAVFSSIEGLLSDTLLLMNFMKILWIQKSPKCPSTTIS